MIRYASSLARGFFTLITISIVFSVMPINASMYEKRLATIMSNHFELNSSSGENVELDDDVIIIVVVALVVDVRLFMAERYL